MFTLDLNQMSENEFKRLKSLIQKRNDILCFIYSPCEYINVLEYNLNPAHTNCLV